MSVVFVLAVAAAGLQRRYRRVVRLQVGLGMVAGLVLLEQTVLPWAMRCCFYRQESFSDCWRRCWRTRIYGSISTALYDCMGGCRLQGVKAQRSRKRKTVVKWTVVKAATQGEGVNSWQEGDGRCMAFNGTMDIFLTKKGKEWDTRNNRNRNRAMGIINRRRK